MRIIKKINIDIKKIFLKYFEKWYWFIIATVFFCALAFIYLRYSTPQYAITSKILIKDDKNGPDITGDGIFKDLSIFNSSKNVLNEIEVLKSQALMQRVLKELSFSCSYFVEGTVKDQEVYGMSLPIRVVVRDIDSTAYGKEAVLQL